MKPRAPMRERRITRTQAGYGWSFSYEHGPSGDRQKVILSGNTEGMNRAMTELRKAKVEAYRLVLASAEELDKPRSHDLKKMYKEPDETDTPLY